MRQTYPASFLAWRRVVLYRRSGNLFVLLHIIRKTSKAVPRAEIEIAKERWRDFKDQMEARPRKRPRAAGGDAS
jgi:phage-related protein